MLERRNTAKPSAGNDVGGSRNGRRGRELRGVMVLGVVRTAVEKNTWGLYKDKENTW